MIITSNRVTPWTWVLGKCLKIELLGHRVCEFYIFCGEFYIWICCCCCSVSNLCLTLCNSTDCSTPGFPVLHHLAEFAETHELSWWCYPAISFTHFPSCPQSFPASGSFPMSRLFVSGGQSIGASVLTSVLPMNIQGWFPLVLTSLISFLSKGLSRVFSSTIIQKYQFFGTQPSLWSQLSHPYMPIGKTVALSIWTFIGKVMSLLFNTLPRFVIAILPRNKCLLISGL